MLNSNRNTQVTQSKYIELPNCKVFCHGKLLETIQMAKLFNDSKYFVDMKMKFTPDETVKKFEDFMVQHNNKPSRDHLLEFVNNHFEKPGEEFEQWTPTDWKESPSFLNSIRDPDYQKWASDLNKLWLQLGRKLKQDVSQNPNNYSILQIDHPVIVPGGRFIEFYYWDSYWIIRGLLISEMFDTAKGILFNFLSIVDQFGFVPNGGRIYYSQRSQPPLLTPMVKSYVEKTNDKNFAISSVELLEREFLFWMNNHTVEVNGHIFAVYGDKSTGPRPESYYEDIETSNAFQTEEEKQAHYSELKAAAESGMDFSSRWFIDENGTNKGTLKNLKCRYIIPVELNAILFWNAKILSEFFNLKGNLTKSQEYEAKAQEISSAIEAVLWHDDIGAWLDYDILNNKRREYFTPTNLSPLWMNCFDRTKQTKITEKILKYIDKTGIDKYPGGVPNTLESTGEQWDFPNVWPPMQYMLIMGLRNLNDSRASQLAQSWADRWVKANFIGYSKEHAMFEKYSAEQLGGYGGGGEYVIQTGFGWTNGVILELLEIYGPLLITSK